MKEMPHMFPKFLILDRKLGIQTIVLSKIVMVLFVVHIKVETKYGAEKSQRS